MCASFREPRPAAETPSIKRLDSWKAIAAYLRRDVTTVQRWERREAMPIHRHLHSKRGSVYALSSELDAWRERRGSVLEADRAGVAEDSEPFAVRRAPAAAIGEARPTHARPRVRLPLLGVGVAVLAAFVVVYLVHRGRAEVVGPQITSLAVLPLRNLSEDTGQQYLADGMTEALISRLSSIRHLRVVSRTSVMRYNDPQQLTVPQIGSALGVDAIVEGSITRAGNRIRVTAQLIRVATDEHFWSETYDREFEDVLTLQSEISQAITEKVKVVVTGEERERLAARRSVAPEVYESYLKGRFALNEQMNRARLEESVGHFEDAIRLDPTFAPAYLGLARAFDTLGTVFAGGPPGETRPKAIEAARKALELDPDLAEARVVLASMQQKTWLWAKAETGYRRALDLSPSSARANAAFASWLLCQGRTEEAVSWVERGRQLDPLSVSGRDVAWILFQSRRFADAERELRAVLGAQPDDTNALTELGFVLSVGERAAEAIPFLERAVDLSGGSAAATAVLIRAYARSGRRADALRLLGQLKERDAAGYVPSGAFVNAYLGLGDTDAAIEWMERAYAEQSNILQFLKVHPFFDPVRNDPRFADLVTRVWSDTAR
jgi:TolB-like protein/Tfp pilus assembly protein PilF